MCHSMSNAALSLLLLLTWFQLAALVPYNPDTHLPTPQLVVKYGYPIETHTVLTADGYFVTLHRIPHGRSHDTTAGGLNNTTEPMETGEAEGPRPAVFVQHGLLCSSADWVLSGPDRALAYVLADAGYDVWLGNARGNTYSRTHANYSTQSRKYWDFSFHEMGVYDLPAVLDYVLAATGEPQLFYIGHSMGTSMFYVMLSERPQYNDKVRAMLSLSPVAYATHVTSPLPDFTVTMGSDALLRTLNTFGVYKTLTNNFPGIGTLRILCRNRIMAKLFCETILMYIGGFGTTQTNTSLIPVILGHTPAGSSTKVFQHYTQWVNSGRFRQYDYGAVENERRYGSTTPPDYKLHNVKVPVSLHYGNIDALSPRTDVMILKEQLPNLIGVYRVPSQFNHLDFMWGKDAKALLYDSLVIILKKY